MTKTKFLKILVLFSSVSLVIIFLCFRSGLFDTYLNATPVFQTSPNGGALNNKVRNDSTQVQKDSSPLLFSSSKVIILTSKKFKLPDSNKLESRKPVNAADRDILLSSSKSSQILQPHHVKSTYYKLSPKTDSLLKQYDTAKLKPHQPY